MRCRLCFVPVFFFVLLAGCSSSRGAPDAAQIAAAERAAKENAEREKELRDKEKRAAEIRLQGELNKDFAQLLGHWDRCPEKNSDGKGTPSMHLEVTVQSTVRLSVVAGSVDSTNECPIRLTGDGGQRFISPGDGPTYLKLTPLAYRLDGEQLTITGSANDPVLSQIDLSGSWRRTDWTKKTEAEIANILKKLDANLVYDEGNPANPIVKVAFNFQAPVYNAHLRIFTGLKHLRDLDLSNAVNLSDPGLAHLAELKHLKQLTLTSLPLSNEAVRALKKELPNCNIIR